MAEAATQTNCVKKGKRAQRVVKNGININIKRRISPFTRFYDYFCVAKKWWDRSKANMSGDLFWFTIFALIQKILIVRNDGHLLLLKIIAALLNGTVKYNNTKSQPLINNTTMTHSKQIHEYLFNIDNSLTIKQWVRDNNKQKGNAKVVMDKIRHEVAKIISYTNNCNQKKSVHVNARKTVPQLHNNNNNNNQVTNNMHNMNNIAYAGYHRAATYTVSDVRLLRYSPLQVRIVQAVQPQVICMDYILFRQ